VATLSGGKPRPGPQAPWRRGPEAARQDFLTVAFATGSIDSAWTLDEVDGGVNRLVDLKISRLYGFRVWRGLIGVVGLDFGWG
jgi:hypothetical protein